VTGYSFQHNALHDATQGGTMCASLSIISYTKPVIGYEKIGLYNSGIDHH